MNVDKDGYRWRNDDGVNVLEAYWIGLKLIDFYEFKKFLVLVV